MMVLIDFVLGTGTDHYTVIYNITKKVNLAIWKPRIISFDKHTHLFLIDE